jgi:hypothetical protein
VAVAGLIWVGDQLAEADHAILGLRHQLVDPARGGEPLAGLLERGERHPHGSAEDVRAGEGLVDGFVILFLDVANDEVHATVSRGSRV